MESNWYMCLFVCVSEFLFFFSCVNFRTFIKNYLEAVGLRIDQYYRGDCPNIHPPAKITEAPHPLPRIEHNNREFEIINKC